MNNIHMQPSEIVAENRFRNFIQEEGQAEIKSKQILEILPHRHPMLFVSFVVALDLEQGRITTKYFVPYNSFWEKGHAGIMPGCLFTEIGSQALAILGFAGRPNESGKKPMLREYEFKLRGRPVVPGDILSVEVRIIQRRREICRGKVEIYIEEENYKILVAEGTITGFLG